MLAGDGRVRRAGAGQHLLVHCRSESELAPSEDQGVVLTLTTAAPDATLQQRELYADASLPDLRQPSRNRQRVPDRLAGQCDRRLGAQALGPAQPSTTASAAEIQNELNAIAGAKFVAFQPAPLPGCNGLPIQFVIDTTDPFEQLDERRADFLPQALEDRQLHLPRHRSQDRPAAELPSSSIATRPRSSA